MRPVHLIIALPLVTGLLVITTPIRALEVPHTFQPNTPALSSEVNANFDALVQAVNNLIPVGSVLAFAGPPTAVPAGWLLCDGRQLDPDTHPDLYAVIGDAHGGDGGFSFRLPDYRGLFLRGVDLGAGNDPDSASRTEPAAGGNSGDAVGSLQNHGFETHAHSISVHSHSLGGDAHDHTVAGCDDSSCSLLRLNDDGQDSGRFSVDSSDQIGNIGTIKTTSDTHGHSMGSSRGTIGAPNSGSAGIETRPLNASVNYIIRCGPADAC